MAQRELRSETAIQKQKKDLHRDIKNKNKLLLMTVSVKNIRK
jgi:hypothetical protein